MSDTNTESGQTTEPQGSPTPAASQTGVSPTSSVSDERLEATIRKILKEESSRNTQSIKDKRIAQLSATQNDFRSRLERLEDWEKKGVSREQALWQMDIEDRLPGNQQPIQQGAIPEPSEGGTQAVQASNVHSSIIAGLGLDANRPEVVQAIRDHGSDLTDFVKAVTQISAAQAAKPTGSPAQVLPTSGGGSSVSAPDLESLSKELAEFQAKPPRTPEQRKRFSELLAQQTEMLKSK